MHSHLIFNIDDGSRSAEESIELVEGLSEMGFSKLITTPHTYKDYFPNTRESILDGFEKLTATLRRNQISIPVEVASEYYGDEHLNEILKNDQSMLTFGKDFVLFEVSMLAASPLLPTIIFNLKTMGYRPVLAHPERYLYHWKNRDEHYQNLNCLLQVNLLSLAGYYGKRQKELGVFLIERDLVDFLGTDIHHAQQLKYLKNLLKDRKMMKLLQGKEFRNRELL